VWRRLLASQLLRWSMQGKCSQRTKRYQRVTLADARADFAQRGLTLLADEYANVSTPMPFRCKKCGYKATLRLNDIRRKGCGCRMCGIKRRVTQRTHSIDAVRSLLLRRGIILLSKTYTNSSTPLSVQCRKCRHRWMARFRDMTTKPNPTGCPPCGLKKRANARRYTVDQVRESLGEMGTALLSKSYLNSMHKLHVRFIACGHTAMKSWNELQSGSGCSRCAKNARALEEDYEALARQFSGTLLRRAASAQAESDWLCPLGHQFSRSYSSIKNLQTFCTKCSSSYAEMLCRAIAEELFGAPFVRLRVKEMRSAKGRPLELDMFNCELRLAIEHNGAHHYGPQRNWGGERAFHVQQANDEARRKYCRKNGILLIEIRQLGSITSAEEAKAQIRRALIRAKRPIPSSFDATDVRNLTPKVATEAYWESVQEAAAGMSLVILPCVYLTAETPVPVKCERGHLTQKTPRSILQGHKCDECNSLRMKKAVRLSDGRLFESGTAAAKALGVTKEVVNKAARNGRLVKGFRVERV